MTVCAETASGMLSRAVFFTRSPLDRYASEAPRSTVPADAAAMPVPEPVDAVLTVTPGVACW
jgi:hypothetical protein